MMTDTDLATKCLLDEIKEQRRRIDELLVSNNEYLEKYRVAARERDELARALLASARVGAAFAKIIQPYLEPIPEDQCQQ